MAKARTAIDREGWIAVFEAAATRKGDELNDEWRWLLVELGMTADSYPALVEALGQGRWRDAKDPRAYVKTVAKREALREEIREKRNDILTIIPSSAGHPEFSVEEALDILSYARETSEAIQNSDGIWRPGGAGERAYAEYYDEDDNGEPVSLRGRLRAKLPEGLLKSGSTPSNEEDPEEIDWRHVPIRVNLSEWATLAAFDAWEIQVMQYHLNGISRDRALVAQPDETSERRFRRRGGSMIGQESRG